MFLLGTFTNHCHRAKQTRDFPADSSPLDQPQDFTFALTVEDVEDPAGPATTRSEEALNFGIFLLKAEEVT